MRALTWILKLFAWPFVLCFKLKRDRGEHEFVLPGLEAIFGFSLLLVTISSLFIRESPDPTLRAGIPMFLFIVYLLIGLYLYFDTKDGNDKPAGR